MDTKMTKLTGLALAALLAIALAAPSLAEAGRGHHRHGHHHSHHDHRHHHHGGYNYIYSQPYGYYRPAYPQYYPAPVYAVPPHMMMGINTGHASFMIRF